MLSVLLDPKRKVVVNWKWFTVKDNVIGSFE